VSIQVDRNQVEAIDEQKGLDEADLVRGAQGGDTGAFEKDRKSVV